MTNPETKSVRIQSMFNRIASRYDLMNRVMTLGQDQGWRRFAVDRARIANDQTLLDLAAGTGDIAFEMKRRCPRARVFAGDFAVGMLQQGKQRKNGDRITWVGCDAMALPFHDQTFDAVVFGYLLRNVDDIDRTLREVFRVLKPGGRVVCLDTTPPPAGLIQAPLRLYLRFGLPLLGRMVAGDAASYAYLSDSTLAFEAADPLKSRFESNGFERVCYKRFMMRTIAVHWGEKP